MIKITIKIDGKDKTFTQDFISGRMFRKTLSVRKLFAENLDETLLDELVGYVVDLYGKQFTIDEFYEGVDARKLLQTIVECSNQVTNRASQEIGASDDPN